MTPQAKLLRNLRRATVFIAVLGIVYLVSRFQTITLPSEGCSPVGRFTAGDRLIVDGRPRPLEKGDAVLIRDVGGRLQLTLIETLRPADGHLWCVSNVPECPGFSSKEAGWIDPGRVAGRVLFGWSF